MAKDKTPQDEELDLTKPVTMADLIVLISASTQGQNQALVDAFAAAMKMNAPPQIVQLGDYDPRNPWGDKVKLTRQVFQNGFIANPLQIKDEDKAMLNRINRSGRYIDRKVEVILSDEGADEILYLRYPNRTRDQANEITSRCKSFGDMIRQIVEEQDAAEQELIDAGRPLTKRRRPYFEGADSAST